MPSLTKTALLALAEDASAAYVDGGEPLDRKIALIAQEHDLEPDEVRRVAEMANQATYAELWKRASGPRTIEFDRADSDRILQACEKNACILPKSTGFHKVARLGRPDGMAAVTGQAVATQAEPTALAKLAAEESVKETGTTVQRLEHLHGVSKIAADRIREKVDQLEAEKLAAEESVAEWMRDELLEALNSAGGLGSRRGNAAMCKAASEIVHAVVVRKPEHVKRAARLALVAGRSIDERFSPDFSGLAKVAGPIEPHRIAGFLSTPDSPVCVVNGDHKLFMDLDILKKVETDLAALRYNLVRADDTSYFVANKIRESSGLMAGGRR